MAKKSRLVLRPDAFWVVNLIGIAAAVVIAVLFSALKSAMNGGDLPQSVFYVFGAPFLVALVASIHTQKRVFDGDKGTYSKVASLLGLPVSKKTRPLAEIKSLIIEPFTGRRKGRNFTIYFLKLMMDDHEELIRKCYAKSAADTLARKIADTGQFEIVEKPHQ